MNLHNNNNTYIGQLPRPSRLAHRRRNRFALFSLAFCCSFAPTRHKKAVCQRERVRVNAIESQDRDIVRGEKDDTRYSHDPSSFDHTASSKRRKKKKKKKVRKNNTRTAKAHRHELTRSIPAAAGRAERDALIITTPQSHLISEGNPHRHYLSSKSNLHNRLKMSVSWSLLSEQTQPRPSRTINRGAKYGRHFK